MSAQTTSPMPWSAAVSPIYSPSVLWASRLALSSPSRLWATPVPLYTATGVKPECYTRLRRVGRITVGGVGALSDLVVGSGVVGANAGAGRPRSSSSSRSIPHGQKVGPVYSSWHSEHSQWLQRPSGCPPPSNSTRAHPSHVGMVPDLLGSSALTVNG